MSYMRASFLMRKTRYVKTYVKWTELFGNREKATILNRGKSPYTKGVIVVDIVDKALRMGEGRQIKKLENVAKATNALEDEIAALDDEELKGQTAKFKQRIENGESLDKLMPEAFATVREASKRTLGLRHFDVQLKRVVLFRKLHGTQKFCGTAHNEAVSAASNCVDQFSCRIAAIHDKHRV